MANHSPLPTDVSSVPDDTTTTWPCVLAPHQIARRLRQTMRVTLRGDNLPVCASRATRDMLADCWRELGYTRIVEIGVQKGYYSRVLLAKIPNCHLSCVDPWDVYEFSQHTTETQNRNYAECQENLAKWIAEGRCTLMRMVSMDALKHFVDGSLDAVYVDGDHTFDFAVTDIVFWSRKLRSGGMMGVHDYCHMKRSGVVKAVDAYTHCHRIDPWFVTREVLPTAFWIKP